MVPQLRLLRQYSA